MPSPAPSKGPAFSIFNCFLLLGKLKATTSSKVILASQIFPRSLVFSVQGNACFTWNSRWHDPADAKKLNIFSLLKRAVSRKLWRSCLTTDSRWNSMYVRFSYTFPTHTRHALRYYFSISFECIGDDRLVSHTHCVKPARAEPSLVDYFASNK